MNPRKCCVSEIHPIGKNLFGIPKTDDLIQLWEEALGIKFKKSYRVCSTHFKECDICNTWISGEGSSKYTICLKKVTLKKGAIPIGRTDESVSLNTTKKICELTEIQDIGMLKDHDYCDNSLNYVNKNKDISQEHISESAFKRRKVEIVKSFYHIVLHNINLISLPNNWFVQTFIGTHNYIAFHKLGNFQLNYKRFIEKQLVITKDSEIVISINNTNVTSLEIGFYCKEINNIENLQQLLITLDTIKSCVGAIPSDNNLRIKPSYFGFQFVESNGQWRHTNCLTVVKDDKNDRCMWCTRLVYIMRKKQTRLNINEPIRIYFSPNKRKKIPSI